MVPVELEMFRLKQSFTRTSMFQVKQQVEQASLLKLGMFPLSCRKFLL